MYEYLKRNRVMNKKLMSSSVFVLLLLGGSILWGCKQNFSQISEKKIVAYLPMWAMPYTPDWEKITHLCLAFGFVQADGTLDMEMVSPYRAIIDTAHQHGVKVLLSIGGGGSRYFSAALLNDSSRNVLVNNLCINIDSLHLDGIDVDFEEWDGRVNLIWRNGLYWNIFIVSYVQYLVRKNCCLLPLMQVGIQVDGGLITASIIRCIRIWILSV